MDNACLFVKVNASSLYTYTDEKQEDANPIHQ